LFVIDLAQPRRHAREVGLLGRQVLQEGQGLVALPLLHQRVRGAQLTFCLRAIRWFLSGKLSLRAKDENRHAHTRPYPASLSSHVLCPPEIVMPSPPVRGRLQSLP